MANRLKMATLETILALHQRQWSIRRIAKELGLHRDTVARYLQQQRQSASSPPSPADASQVKLGQAPLGSEPVKLGQAPIGSEASKIGQTPLGSKRPITPPRAPSLCEPFRALILEQLARGLTAQRIFQDLVREHGFAGKYHSVRRFVRRLGQGRPLPFRRMECAPGEEAQVDFGTGAPIRTADGKRRRTHVFRIVLSHSRRGYSEVVSRQTTDEFLRCLENAFAHFGGVPKVLVPDNLKAAVEQADWFDPDLNPKLRSFAEHYGLAIVPTRPRLPRHKGKVESGVGYVQNNGLRGLTFASLEEENRHLLHWETTVADLRIHGTIRQQVIKVFTEVERPALQPLAVSRFPFFHEGQRSVHRDGHVEVARAYYSVPPEYLGRRVWVRWDGHLVRIFNERLEPIARHVQREPGRFSTDRAHLAAEKISGVERGAVWLLGQTRRIGPEAARWSEAVLSARGIEGVRVLQGLLHLAGRHPRAALEKACGIAFSYGSYRLRTLRTLLQRDAPVQGTFAFLEEHPIIRELGAYTQFVRQALTQEVQCREG
jgi:transposase